MLGFNLEGEVAIISPWFVNGNISDYLQVNPDADRTWLVRSFPIFVLSSLFNFLRGFGESVQGSRIFTDWSRGLFMVI